MGKMSVAHSPRVILVILFSSVTYPEKLDRFTKTTYTYCDQRDSRRYHQNIFEGKLDLTSCFYSVFDVGSEKNNFRRWQEE